MVERGRTVHDAMHDGMQATVHAIASFTEGCLALQGLPEAGPIKPHLAVTISRLEAMRRDLEARARHGPNPDALFIGLNLAQAGLSSLTAAVREMREACHRLQPYAGPRPRWPVDDMDEAGHRIPLEHDRRKRRRHESG